MAGEDEVAGPDVVVKIDAEPAVQKPDIVVSKDPAVADLVSQYKELEAESERRKTEKDEANLRAAEARTEADHARREAAEARTSAVSSQLDTITTALSSAQSEVESAKKDIRNAIAVGDADAQADAYERLADAKARAMRYDEAKADLEVQKARPVTQTRTANVDPVEAYVANRSPQTAQWLRANRDYVIDPNKNKKLTAAHYDAEAEGLRADTPEYFAHVERFVGIRKADDKPVTEGDDVVRPGAAKKAVSERRVAPVNGSARTGTSAGAEVRLSAREAEAASDGTHVWNYDDPSGQKKFRKGDPIGVQEFARRKMKLTEQGAYDRTYETQ